MHTSLLVALLGVAAVAAPASATDLYQVRSGTTSLKIDSASLDLLSSLGLNFGSAIETVTPAEGYDFGFAILPRSTDPSVDGTDFSFSFDAATGALNLTPGSIEHKGRLSFEVDTFDPSTNPDGLALLSPFEIGDFSIGYDGSSFAITDKYTTGLPLFNLAITDAPTVGRKGRLQVSQADVLISSEFNDILENASGNFDLNLTGSRIGSAEIDARTAKVPEPGVVFALVTMGGIALRLRRTASKS